MSIVTKLLSDILIVRPKVINNRGFDEFSFSAKDLTYVGIATKVVQDNESLSNKNVLRGLHY